MRRSGFPPLSVEELAEFLAFDFKAGQIPTFREDWRLEDDRRSSGSGAFHVFHIAFPCQHRRLPSDTIFAFLGQRVLDLCPVW